jgi:DNA-binding transcriptional regulator YdaS (Cro superfamily)
MKIDSRNLVKQAVIICGSQKELAKRIGGTVKQQNVWMWANTTLAVPALRAKQIEKAVGGKITKEQLRPDIFEEDSLPV